MKKTLLLSLAAGLALSATVRAEEAKPAAAAAPEAKKPAAAAAAPETKKPATAAAAATDSKPAAAAADTKAATPAPVAKNDAPGSLKKGNELNDEGKFEEAVAYFTGIGEQSSAKREPYRLLGLSRGQLETGKYDDAMATAQKAIDAKKDLSPAWNILASAQARSGKRAEAIATYEKAIASLKESGADTSKLEANLAELQAKLEEGKPKKQKEAEAKAKAEADKAAADKAAKAEADKKAAAPAADKK